MIGRVACWVWLAAIVCGAMPLRAETRGQIDSDLVFCPLQKEWVRRDSSAAERTQAISDICAPESEKAAFIKALAASGGKTFLAAKSIERIFLDHAGKSRREMSDLPRLPEKTSTPAVENAHSSAPANTSADNAADVAVEIFTVNLRPRTPTRSAAEHDLSQAPLIYSSFLTSVSFRGPPSVLCS